MRIWALPALVFCACVGDAHAGILYQFNVDADGPYEAFSFSFSVPTFVTNGQSPSFVPFTVTNGTTTWTLVDGMAGSASACFDFATAIDWVIDSPCGVEHLPNTGGLVQLVFSTLPTTTGDYTIQPYSYEVFADGDTVASAGAYGTLVVTATPEPGSAILLFTGLSAVSLLIGKKRCRGHASRGVAGEPAPNDHHPDAVQNS
jgi:hypothetical protein